VAPTTAERGQAHWRFALRFAGVAGLGFALYAFPYAENGISESWFKAYLGAYARAVGWVLGVFEPNIVVSGKLIFGRMTLEIVKTCDAMEVNILFCAAVAAVPAPLLRKLGVLAGGLAILVGLNVLRICSLYYIGVHFPSAFETAHLDVWPLALVLLTVALFLLAAGWMTAERKPAHP
jgi:exosortase/archaeosortase family protein